MSLPLSLIIILIYTIHTYHSSFFIKQPRYTLLHQWLLSKSQTLIPTIKRNKLCLEHRVSENLQPSALVALHAAKARGVRLVHHCKRDLVARDLGHVAVADRDGEIGERGFARVDEAADLCVELRALDLRVVRVCDLLVDEEQRCTCVGDGVGRAGVLDDLVADGELGRWELPKACLGLDGDPGHLALELGGVDFAEFVDASTVGVEVGGEDGEVEVAHDVVEEGLCGGFLGAIVDGVQVGEGEAEEAVGIGVLDEGLRDGVGELDGLVLDFNAANFNDVGANDAGCA